MIQRLAYFITPHGYGHAARAAAIMAAVQALEPMIRFEIFTTVPQPFFRDALAYPAGYHPVETDLGLVQHDALRENLPETVRRLNEFFPLRPALIKPLAQTVARLKCRLVLCDVAGLGIAVAQAAGRPSLLIENFTWDWIYEGYVAAEAGMGQPIPYLRGLYEAATYHIQTEPVSRPLPVDLTVPPVSRQGRTPAAQIRQRLEAPAGKPLVMITLGGYNWDHRSLAAQLAGWPDYFFVLAGNSEIFDRGGNYLTLPRHTDFFHPDLVNAADAVIGKAGYSTLAEVYQAGIPFGYLARQQFRETASLLNFIERMMSGLALSQAQFSDGSWLAALPALLALPRFQAGRPNGADTVARFVVNLLK